MLAPLSEGKPFAYRQFHCGTWHYSPAAHQPAAVTVIEGSYSHHPAFREKLDGMNAIRVFVHTSPEEQLRRLEVRCPEKLEMFRARWIPLEKNYFEAYDIAQGAAITIESLPREAEHL